MLFDDGTGECSVHAEGICVLGLLRQRDRSFSALKDRVEEGCRQYGVVRYDSYFSHWNRMDGINNTHNDDEAHYADDAEIDLTHLHFPPPPSAPTNTKNTYNKNNLKNGKVQPALTENFYKILSPAHKVEKELESYLSNKNSSSTFKLQVKIIAEKVESPMLKKSKKEESTDKTNSGENKDNDGEKGTSDPDSALVVDGNAVCVLNNGNNEENSKIDEKDEKRKENLIALENLLRSVSHCDDVTNLTARNIKVQENNDQRPYSISFLSVPTLNSKSLALEAVSVIFMRENEIREEAWKELRTLQFKAALRRDQKN